MALFPSERVDGVALDAAEISALAAACRGLFAAMTAAAAARLARERPVPERAAEVFCRRNMVPLVHLFIDRLLRLERLARRTPGLRVAGACDLVTPNDIQEIEGLGAHSESFNQAVLRRLAPVVGLETSQEEVPPFPAGAAPAEGEFVNYNFVPSGPGERLRRALARKVEPLARYIPRGRRAGLAAMYLGYDSAAIESRGFFARGDLIRVDIPSRGKDKTALDDFLRREVLSGAARDAAAPLERLLSDFGMADPGARARAVESMGDFLGVLTPPSLLEEVPGRLELYVRMLKPFRTRPLFLEEIGALGSTYSIAAARVLGMKILGAQHGGGYGYLDVAGSPQELELPFCDAVISWGWRRWGGVLGGRGVRIIPLPAPWLSERARMWRRRARGPVKQVHDLLLMSDKILPFPRPGSGLEALRSEHIREQAALLRSLVRGAAERGVSILHKPSDARTAALMGGLHAELARLGGGLYRQVEGAGKGLSAKLVFQARLAVWDKPGSGFLECAASGLATMVLWPRFSSREVPEAEGAFRLLESCGVVHRTADSLIEEFLRFRAEPEKWTGDPGRRRAVARFLRNYAWNRDDWARRWRIILRREAAGKSPERL